jgi:hypothetical protein
MKGLLNKTNRVLIFTFFMISSICYYSQDSSKIILLSRDIGPIVDLNEKIEYNILPKYKENFVSAMFYLSADSLYNCKVKLRKDSIVVDTTLTLNYNSIRNTAMRVQYLESIKKGYSSFNMQNVKLIFANNEEVKDLTKQNGDSKPHGSKFKDNLKITSTDENPGINYLVSGNVIEVTKSNDEKILGELICVKDSLVKIQRIDSTTEIAIEEIRSVIVRKESKMLSSMGNGFLIGAGIGAVLGLASGDDEGYVINFSAGTKALIFGAGLGIIGAIIGIAIGSGQSEDEELIIRNTEDLNYLHEFSREAQDNKDTAKILEPSSFETDLQLNKPEIIFDKKFEISIFFATTSSGPAEGIEDQMRKFGFDKTSYSSWFNAGSITHPKSHTGLGQLGTPWMTAIKYYYTKELLFGAFYSGNLIGWTTGYDNNYIDINYSVSTIAAMAWYKYYNISLGLGPAIFLTNAYENKVFNNNKNYESTRIGLVAEAGITYPAQSTFFVSVIAQYRFTGDVNIGPFEVNDLPALPKFNVSYNHVFVGFGAGIRI